MRLPRVLRFDGRPLFTVPEGDEPGAERFPYALKAVFPVGYSWGVPLLLWICTVSPPTGSDCRAFVIDADRRLTVRPTSAGGRLAAPRTPGRARRRERVSGGIEPPASPAAAGVDGRGPAAGYAAASGSTTASTSPIVLT